MGKTIHRAVCFAFWTMMAICAIVQEASHMSSSKRFILLFVMQKTTKYLATNVLKALCQARTQTEKPTYLHH